LSDAVMTLADLAPVEVPMSSPFPVYKLAALWPLQIEYLAHQVAREERAKEKVAKAKADPIHGEVDILRYMRAGWELGSMTPVRGNKTLYSLQFRGIGKGGQSKRASGVAVLKLFRNGRLEQVPGAAYWRKTYRFNASKCALCGKDAPTGAPTALWTSVVLSGVSGCDHVVCPKCSGASSPNDAGVTSRDPYDPGHA